MVSTRLQAAVPFATVEHIGSSAVPGAESKGDLDICLLVPASGHQQAVDLLLEHGYHEQQDTLRTHELCMMVSSEPGCEHAVQVVVEGSSFMNFLRFRDLLKSDWKLLEQYNSVKREAASLGEVGYRERKSAFIEKVLEQHSSAMNESLKAGGSMSTDTFLHIVYLESGMLLSRKYYSGWRDIQDEYADYTTSLGPWPVATVLDFLRAEYPSDPPFTGEQIERFLRSHDETLVA